MNAIMPALGKVVPRALNRAAVVPKVVNATVQVMIMIHVTAELSVLERSVSVLAHFIAAYELLCLLA